MSGPEVPALVPALATLTSLGTDSSKSQRATTVLDGWASLWRKLTTAMMRYF